MATDFSAKYGVKVLTSIQSQMRDGVVLNVRLTRPDAPGRFPAIVEYTPYRRLGEALADYRDERPPIIPYLAERGYGWSEFQEASSFRSIARSSFPFGERGISFRTKMTDGTM